MKKVLAFIFVFLLFSLVFVASAYARQPDFKPSQVAIENAIAWAQKYVLQPGFPVTDSGGVRSNSTFKCGDFVANAYGYPAVSFTAGLIWAVSVVQHPGDWNAPRGSLVFFRPNSYNKGMGHVALSMGGGDLIEAGYDVVIRSSLRSEDRNAAYLGWAWPPLSWPGRSDDFRATALIWAVQIGKAALMTILAWIGYAIIRSRLARLKLARAAGSLARASGA